MEQIVKIKVREVLEREYTIKLTEDTYLEATIVALARIEKDYENEKIILDADDFSEYSIELIDEF